MSSAEMIGAIVGTVCFLIWVPCLLSWLRRGVSIPRYIHIVALATTSVGVACVIGLAAAQAATLGLSIALVGIPPAMTYFGWFWLFGPESAQTPKPDE